MSLEVKIPAVGESVTSGVISAWLKNDGDAVKRGEALLTLDTDKVSTEITAEGDGTLRIKAQAGAEVKIGEVVATIEEGGAAAGSEKKETPESAEGAPPAAKTSEVKSAAADGAAGKKAKPAKSSEPKPAVPPPKNAEPAQAASKNDKANISREAAKTDAAPAPAAAPNPAAEKATDLAAGNESRASISADTPAPSERVTRKKLSPLRRKIAAQLVMAQHTAAILTTFNEADMSGVIALRKAMGEDFQKQHGIKLGFMSFFIKAVVAALKAVPQVNVRVEGDDLVQNNFYDIGVAVGTERGLMVPVVREAHRKSFAEIERDLVGYATKAREGKISMEDLSGGVFTISNGGIYGSLLSTPILNPPQSGILGMHKIQERAVVVDGAVVARPMMYLALSYDHRVVDGREAVTFLVRVKEAIEQPSRLLLEV